MRPATEGTVTSLWRYPVKSMLGEELAAVEVTARGLIGDRAYALVDASDGKAATAKNPRKWPTMFAYRATFVEPPHAGMGPPPVRVLFPDGTVAESAHPQFDERLTEALGRAVTLTAAGSHQRAAVSEEYWPDMEGLDLRDTVSDFTLPEGTFFDCAVVHLLTTSTLGRLHDLHPEGRYEVARFRPNIVVTVGSDEHAFVEDGWDGRTVAIGDSLRLAVTGPCGRCVMTTLAQGDLPQDLNILRTAAQQNHARVGVYAAVTRAGTIRRGDVVRVE